MTRSTWIVLALGGVAIGAALWWPAAPDDGASDRVQPPMDSATPRAEPWQSKSLDASRYQDVIDYNIFRSDRAALARRAEVQRSPPVVDVAVPLAETPKDPDEDYILVGVVLRGPQREAFIEDRRRREVVRVVVPGDFSAGRLEAIDTSGVVYRVNGEDRQIHVGSNFVGVVVAMTPTAERPRPQARRAPRNGPEDEYADPRFGDRPSPEDIERFRRRQRN
ncbi:MAG: hypothetical protein AAF333_05535 [Planctomycetota bacterium]